MKHRPTGWVVAMLGFALIATASSGSAKSGSEGSSCEVPPPHLVGWWSGDDTANDIAGNHHGTLQSGAGFVPGHVGQAFGFDGVNDYVQVPDAPDLRPLHLTVDAWVRATGPAAHQYFIVAKSGMEGRYGYELAMTSAIFPPGGPGGRARFTVLTGPTTPFGDAIGTTSILDGNFHHLAGTYDGERVKLYVDGQLQTSVPFTGTIAYTDDGLLIGRRQHALGDVFSGVIDEVELHDRALSAEDVSAVFQAGSAGKCKTGHCPDSESKQHIFDVISDIQGLLVNPTTPPVVIRHLEDAMTATQHVLWLLEVGDLTDSLERSKQAIAWLQQAEAAGTASAQRTLASAMGELAEQAVQELTVEIGSEFATDLAHAAGLVEQGWDRLDEGRAVDAAGLFFEGHQAAASLVSKLTRTP